jgi:Spy/CpxP family protein refolding chaperone
MKYTKFILAALALVTASPVAAQPSPAESFDWRTRPAGYVHVDPFRDPLVTQLTRVTTEGRAMRLRSVQNTLDTPWNPEVITAARNKSPEWRKFMALMGYAEGGLNEAAVRADERAKVLAEVRALLGRVQ